MKDIRITSPSEILGYDRYPEAIEAVVNFSNKYEQLGEGSEEKVFEECHFRDITIGILVGRGVPFIEAADIASFIRYKTVYC